MVDNGGNQENQSIESADGQSSGEPAKVRRVQEISTTDRLTRLRELLSLAWNADDQRIAGRATAAFILQFRAFDEIMSNGGGLPEQWQLKANFEDFRSIH